MMEIQTEFRSDMHNNYMVIAQCNSNREDTFGKNMLLYNKIPGLLGVDVRLIDNICFYYYDITSKHPIEWIFDKENLSKKQICKLVKDLIRIIEKSKEFLLDEDDFILNPSHLFINSSTDELSLCHYIGYHRDIREQLSRLIEFLMNKIDHTQQDAVLLIYNLYKVSKEENCTFRELLEIINRTEAPVPTPISPIVELSGYKKEPILEKGKIQNVNIQKEKVQTENYQKEIIQTEKNQREKIRTEKIQTEEEVKIYSIKSIVYSVLSLLISILVFFMSAQLGFVYNKETNGLDYTKVFGVLAIVGGLEAYALSSILDTRKKITKVQKKYEYIDNSPELSNHPFFTKEKISATVSNKEYEQEYNLNGDQTVVLAEQIHNKSIKLMSLDPLKYEDIPLREFPFFIGALKLKVDYAIENQTVSRFHAKLEKIAEQYYITDLNSTNGTYVNQTRLGIHERRQINLEDEVAFADVKYRFTDS